jgi:hypothetical protein
VGALKRLGHGLRTLKFPQDVPKSSAAQPGEET